MNEAHVDDNRNLELQVRRAQLETIYAQYVNALVGQLLSAVVITVLIWTATPPWKLVIWLSAFFVVQSARYIHSLQYKSETEAGPLRGERVTFWLRAHVFFTSLTALTWSAGAILLWPDSGFHQVVFQFVILFTVAAALAGHAAYKLSYTSYALIAIVPVSVRFMMVGTRDHIGFGIACIIGIAMLLRVAKRNNISSVEALWLGVKHLDQATVLAEEKATVEALNQQLLQHTQALQESEARFRALSEAAFEGIAIHNRGEILDVNHAATEMIGYDRSEILGISIQDFISPESYEIAAQHMREDYQQPYELVGVRKDGSEFPLEVQSKLIPYHDTQARVVAIRDLTQRKELEQKALAFNLEHARVQLLTTFFQNASHEFRTPLSIISVAAHILGRTNQTDLGQEKLAEINQQVERINELVDGLQFMVKLDIDGTTNRSSVDINFLFADIDESFSTEIADKNLQLNLNLKPNLPTIQADADLLYKAFTAIIDNALRYTAQGGTITVRTACDGNNLKIEFEDNGIGLTDESLDRILNASIGLTKPTVPLDLA